MSILQPCSVRKKSAHTVFRPLQLGRLSGEMSVQEKVRRMFPAKHYSAALVASASRSHDSRSAKHWTTSAGLLSIGRGPSRSRRTLTVSSYT